jgi:hypothetical protein
MELILGLPPLTQFDAASTPMYASFAAASDTAGYTSRPARIDIFERNPDKSIGQMRSDELDFSIEDAIPDVELNEIIWKSVRGEHSDMPAPVRSAFVQVQRGAAEDDD